MRGCEAGAMTEEREAPVKTCGHGVGVDSCGFWVNFWVWEVIQASLDRSLVPSICFSTDTYSTPV